MATDTPSNVVSLRERYESVMTPELRKLRNAIADCIKIGIDQGCDPSDVFGVMLGFALHFAEAQRIPLDEVQKLVSESYEVLAPKVEPGFQETP